MLALLAIPQTLLKASRKMPQLATHVYPSAYHAYTSLKTASTAKRSVFGRERSEGEECGSTQLAVTPLRPARCPRRDTTVTLEAAHGARCPQPFAQARHCSPRQVPFSHRLTSLQPPP